MQYFYALSAVLYPTGMIFELTGDGCDLEEVLRPLYFVLGVDFGNTALGVFFLTRILLYPSLFIKFFGGFKVERK